MEDGRGVSWNCEVLKSDLEPGPPEFVADVCTRPLQPGRSDVASFLLIIGEKLHVGAHATRGGGERVL